MIRRALVFFGVASLALIFALAFARWMPAKPAPRLPDLRVVALAESLATARAEARANLEAWMIALQDRDTVIKRVVRYVERHDTTWRDTGDVDTVELVRWLAVSDSSQRVRGDSLAGELVQCRYDADQCSEVLQARPESCGTWSAFGLGFGAGFSAAAAGCAVLR